MKNEDNEICHIIGLAMNTIAGTETTIDFEQNEGCTSSEEQNWNSFINTETVNNVYIDIKNVVNRAYKQANLEKFVGIVGLVIGSNFFETYYYEKYLDLIKENIKHEILTYLVEDFNINGITMCDSTACSSGGSAIVSATQLLEDNICDVVIVLGYDIQNDVASNGMRRIGALSKDKIRPFSFERTGTDLADGIGVLILSNNELLKNRTIASIVGYGVYSDGYNVTSPDPSGQSLYLAMTSAIKMANVGLNEIQYINAHGSGTKLNDQLETEIIKKVFGENSKKIYINSSKSLVGHTLGAAGIIELIITVLQMQQSIIHPTANFISYDEKCDLNYCIGKFVSNEIKYALSNSIGFGGVNVCVAMKKQKKTIKVDVPL